VQSQSALSWIHVAAWLPMAAIAIANGATRDLVYGRRLSDLRAHQVSTLTALVLLGLFMAALFAWRPLGSLGGALVLGLVWLGLTLAFELLFGHYVAGHPWRRLLADYDLSAGRVWIAIPLWMVLGPALLYLGMGQGRA
jgi:hypothetical protein